MEETLHLSDWDWWTRALAKPLWIGSAELPIHNEPSGNGFFRVRRKGGDWEPVHIWRDDIEGGWRARRNGNDVSPDQIETLWTYCCRQPISEAAYDRALRGEGFEDEPTPSAKVDNDDPFVELTHLFNGESTYAQTLLMKPIESESEASKVAIVAKRISELANSADRLFEIEKEPIRKQAKEIDDKWRDLREGAKKLATALKRHSDAWLTYLKRMELQRQAKAREEAERLRREADEKMRAAKQANDPTGNAVFEAGKAISELKQAERELEPQKVQAGRTGARLSLKTFYSARIVDQDKLYAAVRDNTAVVAALQQIADAAARSSAHIVLPGCELVEEERTV